MLRLSTTAAAAMSQPAEGAPEPCAAPFRILADVREALGGWQFTHLPDRTQPGRRWTAAVEYRVFDVAGYGVAGLPLWIVRYTLPGLLERLRMQPGRLATEHAALFDLVEAGIECLIVLEGGSENAAEGGAWTLPPQTEELLEICDGRIPWLFIENPRLAEQLAFEVLERAWRQAQANRP